MVETLAELTTLHLGGPAGRVVTASSSDELVSLVAAADAAGEPVLIVGGGSNLLVGDAGWPGVVVLVRSSDEPVVSGDSIASVTVPAGSVWDPFVAWTLAQGLSGLAALSGIPGSVGATPIQNVGAYGVEVSDFISALTVYDRETRTTSAWSPSECGFGFRTSAFKHTDRYVILDVTFDLPRSEQAPPIRYLELARRLGVEPGAVAPSEQVRSVVLELRRSKGMVLDPADHDTWSVGSFFVNPLVAADQVPEGCPNWDESGQKKLSAAWLIEHAGFSRGYPGAGSSRVSVSTKHTLALTNRGGATTAELLELAAEIRAGVEARFGIRLRPEAHLANVTF